MQLRCLPVSRDNKAWQNYVNGSLFKEKVSVHIKKQMCFNSKEREIKMKIAGVQQQTNGIDCDLYAASRKYIYT